MLKVSGSAVGHAYHFHLFLFLLFLLLFLLLLLGFSRDGQNGGGNLTKEQWVKLHHEIWGVEHWFLVSSGVVTSQVRVHDTRVKTDLLFFLLLWHFQGWRVSKGGGLAVGSILHLWHLLTGKNLL